jgi:hypothetical protein
MAGRLKIYDGTSWVYVDGPKELTSSWTYNAISANSASYAITASHLLNFVQSPSSSWASQSLSSSYAVTASHLLNFVPSPSSSWASSSISSISSSYTSGSIVTNNTTFATASTFLYGSGSAVAHRTALKIVQMTSAEYASLVTAGTTDMETIYIVSD